MIRVGNDLHLNPTEVIAASSINLSASRLEKHSDGFHMILHMKNKYQANYWQEQIMLAVEQTENQLTSGAESGRM